jgi:hypothetical protein
MPAWSNLIYIELVDDSENILLADDDELTLLVDDPITSPSLAGSWTPQAAASNTWTPEDAL